MIKIFDTCNEMQHPIHHIVPYTTWKKENSILVKTRSFVIVKKRNIAEFNDFLLSVSHQRQFLCLAVVSLNEFYIVKYNCILFYIAVNKLNISIKAIR